MAGIHDGHRQRMKQRFLKEGMEHMQPHEILELLLFYVIGRKDTNVLAHRLLNSFGSLAKVLEAPYEDLRSVEGVGAETATFLKMMIPLMQAYIKSDIEGIEVLNTFEKCGDHLLKRYFGLTVERMSVLCMNSLYELQSFIWLGTGNASSVTCGAKDVISAVMRQPCNIVVLAHNHPSNILLPSEADVQLTKSVKRLLNAIGIHLIDHIILSKNDFISMANSYGYEALFK